MIEIYCCNFNFSYGSVGFERFLMVCCGYGGSFYNYNVKIICVYRGVNVCDKGFWFVSWDGIYYIEIVNVIVVMKVFLM